MKKRIKLIRYSEQCACAGLLLGFTVAVGHTASVTATPQQGAAQTVSSQDGTDQKDNPDRKDVSPLPEAGETAYFRYVRDRGGMYQIMPTDGSQPYLVSASFLQVTLDSPNLDSFQQAELLRTYPALMQEMFTKTMAQAYPDGTVEYEAPFSTQWFEGTDGTQMLLAQDPVAAPYIRVQLTSSEGGKPVEFSVARAVVEQMLANERVTDDQLITGLQSVPFKLPEAARVVGFIRLSAAELAMLVQSDPELRQYDFVQMGRIARDGTGTEGPSAETPRQPATSSSVAPLELRQRPALAQLPSHPSVTRETGEQPQPDSRAHAPGIHGFPPQVAKPLKRAPIAGTEAVSAYDTRTSELRLGLQILGVSLFAFGIIALVVSRRTR